jgi:hypothetical protein
MKIAMTNNTIILSDFNIDDSKIFYIDYAYCNYFCDLAEAFAEFGLVQVIKFVTCSRLAKNTLKTSVLDHVYVSDAHATTIVNVGCIRPCFGNHMLVTLELILSNQAIGNQLGGTGDSIPKKNFTIDSQK